MEFYEFKFILSRYFRRTGFFKIANLQSTFYTFHSSLICGPCWALRQARRQMRLRRRTSDPQIMSLFLLVHSISNWRFHFVSRFIPLHTTAYHFTHGQGLGRIVGCRLLLKPADYNLRNASISGLTIQGLPH